MALKVKIGGAIVPVDRYTWGLFALVTEACMFCDDIDTLIRTSIQHVNIILSLNGFISSFSHDI